MEGFGSGVGTPEGVWDDENLPFNKIVVLYTSSLNGIEPSYTKCTTDDLLLYLEEQVDLLAYIDLLPLDTVDENDIPLGGFIGLGTSLEE